MRAAILPALLLAFLLALHFAPGLLRAVEPGAGTVPVPIPRPLTDMDRETLFRVSTLPALMLGAYDGVLPVADLTARGDLGLGTFDGLEGEMVVLDGQAWQVLVDGSVAPAAPNATTPYAAVTRFEPDAGTVLLPAKNLEDLEDQLAALLPGPNLPCAVRVHGEFTRVKTRSVPRQDKPYPLLTEAAKGQRVFEAGRTVGTIVGFWLPETWANVGVAGFHLHFLSDDRDFGGHLLDAAGAGLNAEIDVTPGLMVVLPETEGFQSLDLGQHDQTAVDQVERQ